MAITYYADSCSFKLDAGNTTYMIGLWDQKKYIVHLYYGKHISDTDVNFLLGPINKMKPSEGDGWKVMVWDAVPFEYATFGTGDFRDHALEVETLAGNHTCELTYVSHTITKGKPAIPGLPATFGAEDDCTTLELLCRDEVLNLDVVLRYTTFENLDVITRSVSVINQAEEPIYLKRVFSASMDLNGQDYDIVTLHGSWAKECQLNRIPVSANRVVTESSRGVTSAQSSPLLAVIDSNAGEDNGDVYAMNLVYSGNFYGSAEGYHNGGTRMAMGINPQNFTWKLESKDTFDSPEVVMVFSDEGFGKMTRTYHDLYRNHLIRSPYKDKERPILVNNWEATYFDFNETKLLELAKDAAACGIEMLVLDDGWFGERCIDDRGLGDWVVNEEKLKGGLGKLAGEVNELGMKFGLWIEPEMVNENSDLFRAHPDWAITIPGRTPSLGRNQLVLDWSRKEVRDGVYSQIRKVLDNANVEYIKWDMNRYLTDLNSVALPADRQQELSHRYVLGVYDIMGRLIADYPNLLYENCSSGGARFDPGILYFSPQVWTSDDSDAIERIRIQAGTSMCYPLSTMGAHVSAVPNHQTGRVTPFETRGIVALSGTFGYELDITKLSDEEKNLIKKQTKRYHKYNKLVREGDLYRLSDVFHPQDTASWSVVAKDKSEVLVTFVQIHSRPGYLAIGSRLRLKGLDPDATYILEEQVSSNAVEKDAAEETDSQIELQASGLGGGAAQDVIKATGEALMSGGFWIDRVPQDYSAQLFHFVKQD